MNLSNIPTAYCGTRRLMRRRRGSVYLLAFFSLILLAALGLNMSYSSSMEYRKAVNHRDSLNARLAAESGVAVLMPQLLKVRVGGETDMTNFGPRLANQLEKFIPNPTGEANVMTVPEIVIDPDAPLLSSFAASVYMVNASLVRMDVYGYSNGAERRITVDFFFEDRRPAVFDYGIATKGPLTIHGNPKVVGVNDSHEGSVMSATQMTGVTSLSISGSAYVSGDACAAGSTGDVDADPALVGGEIKEQIDMPDFPDIDTSELVPLAVNAYDPNSDTLTNVIIPPNTDPVFSKNVTINGIVYVQSPNNVKFAANNKVDMNGMIVTEPAAAGEEADCSIEFAGGVEVYGVENLPDTAEFADIKQHTGTFILAEGYDVSFAGHVKAVNGSIAASQIKFTGTAEGTISGSVIGLDDGVTNDVGGTVDIYIDHKNANQSPAGFVPAKGMVVIAGTYQERYD